MYGLQARILFNSVIQPLPHGWLVLPWTKTPVSPSRSTSGHVPSSAGLTFHKLDRGAWGGVGGIWVLGRTPFFLISSLVQILCR